MQQPELLVPVYLNQRIVFDLVAMLQGGIATVTSITETSKKNVSKDEEAKASFGLSNAFSSLLKIDLSGTKKNSDQTSIDKTLGEERVHTPSSLFYTLRSLLFEEKKIRIDSKEYQPKSGDLLEFNASLSRNPIIETMDSFIGLIEIFEPFFPKETKSPKSNPKGQHVSNTQDLQKIKKQMESFLVGLKAGDSIDLTAKNLESGYHAVLTLESKYLNDPLMSDLVDGTFHVVGKVIRSVHENEGSINLIRKTVLSKMPLPILTEAFGKFSELSHIHGFALPELIWEIKGPVVQVLPIAIFA
ncbi:MAG: hypothetical protein AB7S75_13750 [Desulfococcaceae bacterium]